MPQPTLVPNRVMIVVATASSVATLGAFKLVERLLGEPSLADLPAMVAGVLVATGLVFVIARVVLGPALLVRHPLPPLSQSARRELVAGIAVILAVGFLSRLWFGIDGMLSLPLLYVPLVFVWLRREFARH